MFIVLLILLIVIIVVVPTVNANSARSRSRALHARVIALGDVTAHDYQAILAKLGNPNAIDGLQSGGQLVQWIQPHYHIAMTFDANGNCLGIDHESAI